MRFGFTFKRFYGYPFTNAQVAASRSGTVVSR